MMAAITGRTSSPLSTISEILSGGSPVVVATPCDDVECVQARIKEERSGKRFAESSHPWIFILVTEVAFFAIAGLLLLFRPCQAAKAVRDAVLGQGQTHGLTDGEVCGYHAPLHGVIHLAQGEEPLKFSFTEFLLRLIGCVCLSLLVFIVDAIRRRQESFALTYGIFRLTLSFGLSMLLFTGGKEARVVVPFLLHGLWVGLTTLNYAPVSWHTGLRSVYHRVRKARDAVLTVEAIDPMAPSTSLELARAAEEEEGSAGPVEETSSNDIDDDDNDEVLQGRSEPVEAASSSGVEHSRATGVRPVSRSASSLRSPLNLAKADRKSVV